MSQDRIPEQTLEESELLRRINWFIRIRWLAAISVIVAAYFGKRIFNINYPELPLYIAGLIIAIYNGVFYIFTQNLEKKVEPKFIVRQTRTLANLQISLDLIALTFLIHFTGGIENPFIFYFIFHMIISSILLSTRTAFLQATLAVVLLSLLSSLEYRGIISHITVSGYGMQGLYQNINYVMGNLFVFITTIYVSVYMATSITRRLRKRQYEIMHLKEDLENKTKMLEEINEKLVKLDALKTKFLSMASHDLKSPLGAVESYLRIILGGFVGDVVPKQKELLERSSLRIKELLKLINDLLDISSIEKGQIIQEIEKVSLKEIVEKSIEDIKSSAEEKDLEIQITMPEDPMFLNAAGDRLEEVFINLLSNAIKFTPEGGRIILNIIEDRDYFKIKVEDTGVGIPQEEQSKIFEDFYQASNVETKKIKGAGLGLSIVKQIVEAHQGRIWLESALGKGTKFFFTMPKGWGSKK